MSISFLNCVIIQPIKSKLTCICIRDLVHRCRDVANHSRVAECTHLSPEGEYSGLARISPISVEEHDEHRGFRVVRAAGA